ncbi:MAG TPA: lanthionine synthetase LanC family protein, partial [Polyangiaceae bacterium]|nr:lanthionine synthetase LanC family protein [Polyangiaceae bacterium]
MKPSDRLVLANNLLVTALDSLGSGLPERAGATRADWVVTRPGSRSRAVVIDADAAAFIEQFRTPTSIAEAVVRHATATRQDPEGLLDAAAPLVWRLRQHRFIAVEGDSLTAPIERSLQSGARAANVEVLECVHLFENVEVYRARRDDGESVALKLLRPAPTAASVSMLRREAAILTHLGGYPASILLDHGDMDGRPYLLQRWCEGLNASHAAAVRRGGPQLPAQTDLLELCLAILRAYVSLHARGVVHGDVHPGNVIVSAEGVVTLLDFGLSPCADYDTLLPPPGRGGVYECLEPEFCAALLAHEPPPPASFVSEQYAVSSMLYALLTGKPPQDFSLERQVWLTEVVHGAPLSFAARGLAPWPELEMVLARGLDRNPKSRFASLADLLGAFQAATQRHGLATETALGREFVDAILRHHVLRELPSIRKAFDGLPAPRCSFTYGSAGVAYFLYRMASLRGDPQLLASADVWVNLARQHATSLDAFQSQGLALMPEGTGLVSPLYRESGVHLVQALVSRAMGDLPSATRATREFIATVAAPCLNPDLTLGHGSVLIGCAALLEALPHHASVERRPLLVEGDRLSDELIAFIAAHHPSDARDIPWLGMAHGWAGLLYSLLRWTQATGSEVMSIVLDRLRSLAALGKRDDSRLSWPLGFGESARGREGFTGWCHGSAGYMMLWLLAFRVSQDEQFL